MTKEGTLLILSKQLLESLYFVIKGPKTIDPLYCFTTKMSRTTCVVSSSTTISTQNTPTGSQQSSTSTVTVQTKPGTLGISTVDPFSSSIIGSKNSFNVGVGTSLVIRSRVFTTIEVVIASTTPSTKTFSLWNTYLVHTFSGPQPN